MQSWPEASEIGQAMRLCGHGNINRVEITIDHRLLTLQRWQIYTNIAPHFY